jgi:hypothetical protein
MSRIKLFIVLAIGIAGLCATSCEKERTTSDHESLFNPAEEFSSILSKALYENESLREFVKNEALTQFDKDYDVFYPFAKNKLVDNGRTFESILKEYDKRNVLERIESNLPLLNILVPDWSWAEGFSVLSWDTKDPDVSVAYKDDFNAGLQLYNKGEKELFLEYGRLTNFPVLIVKENERMKRSFDTKAKCTTYDFIDPAFDGTKTKDSYWDRTVSTEIPDISNIMSMSELEGCSAAIDAYTLFKNHPTAVHRDHIYYGMTNQISEGRLNVHITEHITKFRFETLNSGFLLESDDFRRTGEYVRYVPISDQTLIDKFIYGGNLELYFYCAIGSPSGTPTCQNPSFLSVSFRDAFHLTKVHVRYRNETWVRDRRWTFTVDEDECFVPKWINTDIALPKWDISNQSGILNIKVMEFDNEETTEYTFNVVSSFSNDFKLEGGYGPEGDKPKDNKGWVKAHYGYSCGETTTQQIKTTIKQGSDDLGTALVYYSDPVILSPATTQDGQSGYKVKEYSTSFIHMLIVPKYE